jgi:hypothetical protein
LKGARAFPSGVATRRGSSSATATPEELEAQLIQAVESLGAGKGADGEALLRRFRKRIKEARA